MRIISTGSFIFLFMLLVFFLPTIVIAQEGSGAVGEGEAGKGTEVTEDAVKKDDAFRKGLEEGGKRLVEEEYWKDRLEKYRKKVQKKREEDLRKAQERERIEMLLDMEMFLNVWTYYDMPRPARPPIKMEYADEYTLDKLREKALDELEKKVLDKIAKKEEEWQKYLDEHVRKKPLIPLTPEEEKMRDEWKEAWEKTRDEPFPTWEDGEESTEEAKTSMIPMPLAPEEKKRSEELQQDMEEWIREHPPRQVGPDAIGPVTGPFAITALVEDGLVDMECTGTGRTDAVVFNLTNKTGEPILAVIPAGTPLVTDSEGYQPYQTGVIASFFLEPGQTLTRECPAWCTDNDLEPAPADGSAKYTLQTSSFTPQQERVRELILLADYIEYRHTFCGDIVEPDDFVQSPQPPATKRVEQKEPKNVPQSTSLSFNLSSPLEFPGTMQFALNAEGGILKHNISSKDDKNEEIVFTNPQGKVDVSIMLTENAEVLKFDITKLSAQADSFEVSGNSMGNINMVLGSSGKSTGFLDINTGEVNGTVSVKAWGKKYEDPFPAAGTFTGRFDFPTRKLSMSFSGLSFDPVKLESGPYQTNQPGKFWDSVHLYSVWSETNNIGEKELRTVMTEQLKAEFPDEKAEELSQMVTTEIMDRVEEVQSLHKKLKEEDFDFSMLDPTLKLRKTETPKGGKG